MTRRIRAGFTVAEIAVIIAIVILLIAILLPGTSSRPAARRVVDAPDVIKIDGQIVPLVTGDKIIFEFPPPTDNTSSQQEPIIYHFKDRVQQGSTFYFYVYRERDGVLSEQMTRIRELDFMDHEFRGTIRVEKKAQ